MNRTLPKVQEIISPINGEIALKSALKGGYIAKLVIPQRSQTFRALSEIKKKEKGLICFLPGFQRTSPKNDGNVLKIKGKILITRVFPNKVFGEIIFK